MTVLAYDEIWVREPRLMVPGKQPLGAVRIDPAHPLAPYWKSCQVWSAPNRQLNGVKLTAYGTITDYPTSVGLGRKGNGSTGYHSLTISESSHPGLFLFVHFTALSVATGAAQIALGSAASSVGAFMNVEFFNGVLYASYRAADSGANTNVIIDDSPSNGTSYCVLFVVTSSQKIKPYINGVALAESVVSAGEPSTLGTYSVGARIRTALQIPSADPIYRSGYGLAPVAIVDAVGREMTANPYVDLIPA